MVNSTKSNLKEYVFLFVEQEVTENSDVPSSGEEQTDKSDEVTESNENTEHDVTEPNKHDVPEPNKHDVAEPNKHDDAELNKHDDAEPNKHDGAERNKRKNDHIYSNVKKQKVDGKNLVVS
jgi:hypothetical protein